MDLVFIHIFGSRSSIAMRPFRVGSLIGGRDENGQPTGSINVSSSIISTGVSYKFHPIFRVGLGIKYFLDKLADVSVSGVGFDLGLFFKPAVSGFTAGLSVQNLGGKVEYEVEKQEIPLVFRGGIAYSFYFPDIVLPAHFEFLRLLYR